MIAPVIAEEEQRRIDGIRFLAKTNPVKYQARYSPGRLELYYNCAHKEHTRHGQMYLWSKQKT